MQSQNQMSKLLQMSKDIVYCSADKLNFELNMQKRMTHWVLFWVTFKNRYANGMADFSHSTGNFCPWPLYSKTLVGENCFLRVCKPREWAQSQGSCKTCCCWNHTGCYCVELWWEETQNTILFLATSFNTQMYRIFRTIGRTFLFILSLVLPLTY